MIQRRRNRGEWRARRGLAAVLCIFAAAANGCGSDAESSEAVNAADSLDVGPDTPDIGPKSQTEELAPGDSNIAVLSPRVHDWGVSPPGEDIEVHVEVKNMSEDVLTIQDIKTDCRCTAFNGDALIGRRLEPGESVQITATVQGRPLPGTRASSVKVKFTGVDAIFESRFMGEYSLPIRTEPRYFNMSDPRTVGRANEMALTGTVVLESVDGKPFRVLSVDGDTPQFADGFDPEADEARSTYTLSYDFSSVTEDSIREFWLIETDREDCPVVDMWLRHPWAQLITMPRNPAGGLRLRRGTHLTLNQKRISLGNISAADSGEAAAASRQFTLRVRKAEDKIVDRVRCDSDEFTASLVSVEADGEDTIVTIRITLVDPDYRGVLYGLIWVASERAKAPVYVIGRVVD